MKQIIYLTIFLFLANCSTHSVKLGKRCTKIAEDNTYEKSLIWLIDKKSIETFDQKINKKTVKLMERMDENPLNNGIISILVGYNFSPSDS